MTGVGLLVSNTSAGRTIWSKTVVRPCVAGIEQIAVHTNPSLTRIVCIDLYPVWFRAVYITEKVITGTL